MRRLAVALSLLLAGCAEPGPPGEGLHPILGEGATATSACPARPERERLGEDWSREDLVVDVVTSGAFTLDVPLPVSAGGSSAQEWAVNATASGPATLSLATTESGFALRIVSEEPRLQVIACTIQAQSPRGNGCCAEQFLDRQWSMPKEEDRLRVRADGPALDVTMAYRAEANWCGADGEWAGSGLMGWAWMQGGDSSWCE